MDSEPPAATGSMLDLAHLREISGNDAVTMCEVIDVFLEHAPALMRELQDQHQARDGNGLRRVAHKLKPMLAYVGMTSMHMRTVQIENANPEAVDLDAFTDLVRSLVADFEPARLELVAFRSTLSAP